jgi:hypothetical protein
MQFQTHNDRAFDLEWPTSLQGTIQATPLQLAYAFGAPLRPTEGDGKVTTRWSLLFADGRTADIYDWKHGRIPGDDERVAWNIGATSREIVERVHEAFRQALTKLQTTHREAA